MIALANGELDTEDVCIPWETIYSSTIARLEISTKYTTVTNNK
jgi:hypothetical protein